MLVLGVSCLLTLSVNKFNVILNNALFFSDLLGSIEAVKMSRSTFCCKYWFQFINHEISTSLGIRWYIANVLMHCGFVSSVDQVVNHNYSEFLTSYVDNKAICIYQTCYHDTRYYFFKIMDYDGPDSVRELAGTILSYNKGNQYYPKFCNDTTLMCFIPKCYGASKPASKQDDLVKLRSQQRFEEIKSRCCQVEFVVSNS